MWLHGYLDLTYLGDLIAYNENKQEYLFSSSSQHIIFPINFITNTTIEHDFSCNIWPWHLGMVMALVTLLSCSMAFYIYNFIQV